ncbi:UPF0721 transmembrane protein [Desulfuromonas versatilis]|uniref:Probable membrane transporter protein n=1 Tax=Desulfuromonas versatilis TaxID=2802975 RepID=A0ABM8HRR7_9BACT|nr:TSUP family transporter [Desulfuromonas versatilis]BCR04605.1 UPF0721 transmembrane protein [Desulfuromonas versatilis]
MFDWQFTPELLAMLFSVGLIAGTIDAIAGGGGLLTLPALLACGLPPLQAIATAKLQSTVGVGTAAFCYLRKGQVDLDELRPIIGCTLLGSLAGALCLQHADPQILESLLPIAFLGVAGYFLLSPRVGDLDRHQRISRRLFALLIGTGIGFYDGFFGPGTGSFFSIAFISLLGCNLRRATASTKVLNLTSNLAALVLFIHADVVVWSLGLTMAAGQVLGSTLGARLAMHNGARLIRPLAVMVSLAMIFKFWAPAAQIFRMLRLI